MEALKRIGDLLAPSDGRKVAPKEQQQQQITPTPQYRADGYAPPKVVQPPAEKPCDCADPEANGQCHAYTFRDRARDIEVGRELVPRLISLFRREVEVPAVLHDGSFILTKTPVSGIRVTGLDVLAVIGRLNRGYLINTEEPAVITAAGTITADPATQLPNATKGLAAVVPFVAVEVDNSPADAGTSEAAFSIDGMWDPGTVQMKNNAGVPVFNSFGQAFSALYSLRPCGKALHRAWVLPYMGPSSGQEAFFAPLAFADQYTLGSAKYPIASTVSKMPAGSTFGIAALGRVDPRFEEGFDRLLHAIEKAG